MTDGVVKIRARGGPRPAEAAARMWKFSSTLFKTVWGGRAGVGWGSPSVLRREWLGFELGFMGARTLLLLFLELWVLLMGVGVGGGGSAKEGVRGTEWSEAGVGAIFHSDKINSALKGGEGGQRKLGQAYLGLQRSKGASSRSDRPCF